MKQFSYVLTQSGCLRGRPVVGLQREASRFSSRVSLGSGEKCAPLTATHAVSQLGLNCGKQITVTVEGRDEEAAVAAIQNYFVANL